MNEPGTDIVLNETDRDLIELAARILMALDPGPTREDAAEAIARAYRDDLGEVHIGSTSDVLDELTVGFGGAILLEMERVNEEGAEVGRVTSGGASQRRIVSPSDRRRVIEALGQYLEVVIPALIGDELSTAANGRKRPLQGHRAGR